MGKLSTTPETSSCFPLPATPRPSHSSTSTRTPHSSPFESSSNTPRRSLPTIPQRTSGLTFHSPSSSTTYVDDDVEESTEELPAYLAEPDIGEVVMIDPSGGNGSVAQREDDQLSVPALTQQSVSNFDIRASERSTQPSESVEQGTRDQEHAGESRVGGVQRFGRWREWAEKRAVERTHSDPDRQERRNAQRQLPQPPEPPSYEANLSPLNHVSSSQSRRYFPAGAHPTLLCDSSLLRLDYGSSIESQSSHPINCVYPLNESLVLLGTSHGLKVLNMDDKDKSCRNIWVGLPVWEIHALSHQSSGKRYLILLVGGIEESTKDLNPKPKKNSGTQVRIYNSKSLISLAKYSSIQVDTYIGIDLSQAKSAKGKKKSKQIEWIMIDRSSSISSNTSQPQNVHKNIEELAKSWSEDYTCLSSNDNSQGDNLLIQTYISPLRIFVAIGKSNNITIHGAFPNSIDEEIRFSVSRQFYLPAQPIYISFLQLPFTPNSSLPSSDSQRHLIDDETSSLFSYDDSASTCTRVIGIGENLTTSPRIDGQCSLCSENHSTHSLGLYISFGSKACLIRIKDSTVLDFKLKQSSNNRSDWSKFETLKLKDGIEIYVITRGKETFLFSAPFQIPSQSNIPLHTILWPESPSSISAITENSSEKINQEENESESDIINIRLISTSFTGNLHV
ncbi:uncharacterized protein I206_101654 [Kwoniella pini CBS 10737]|uniref:Uncharacterized protein n=1 Tax=Kwoniella pini CBS 10737 TaxID=1296096 RepID=A0A1B9HW24_9TREE|nr:uncharacterized protein I206_06376 [Kwoniella pini CBS 10737]OCF47475.1 hypothetical protein I206_06376 [Kwoniella pini CBS 10737]